MKFVGFGDLLVCLSAPGYERFLQARSFDVNYSGAEANVCVSLSHMGLETEFVTRIPENEISVCAVANLRKFNVGTRHIAYGGERIGLLYLEKGASQRSSKVIYDRKHTAVCEVTPEMFQWEEILDAADFFHFTGITAALSEQMPQVLTQALQCAKGKRVHVSCDLNYRGKLWNCEKAQSTMPALLPYVDLLIGNEEDAEKSLGIRLTNTNVEKGQLDGEDYISVARQIHERYGVRNVAFTLRSSKSASENGWAGMLLADGRAYFSKCYDIHIVDRVGGGDSFSAGLIYGLAKGWAPQRVIEFATAASCLKQTIQQDFNLSTVAEIEALVSGSGSGRVQR